MSLFDVLLEVKDKSFSNNEVMDILADYIIGRDDSIYTFGDNGINIIFVCVRAQFGVIVIYTIEGIIFNNQYIIHIKYSHSYSIETEKYIDRGHTVKYYKRSAGVPVTATNIILHEEINLSGITFSSLLPNTLSQPITLLIKLLINSIFQLRQMSLFDELFKVRHKPLNSDHVMNEISSFLANKRKDYRYEGDDVTLLFSHITSPGRIASYHRVTGFIYNSQYIAYIRFRRFYLDDYLCIDVNNFTFHKLSIDVSVSISTISQHEKIDLPDATFNMFLPQHVKSASNFTSKVTD